MLTNPVISLYSVQTHDILSFQHIFENVNDAIIATDADYMITHWNKAAERIYGIEKSEAIGTNQSELLPYDYIKSSALKQLQELAAYGKWKGVVKFTKKDKTEVYLQASYSVIKNEEGDIVGYVAINRDITKQYLNDVSLQNCISILHSLDESFLIVDRDMKVALPSCKKNAARFVSSKYKIGDHALKYMPDRYVDDVSQHYRSAFTGETISHEVELKDQSDTKVYFHVKYMPIKNNFGNITHVAVIIKDITDEKRMAFTDGKRIEAEKQLFESRQLFENFMENCPLPAWVTDGDGIMQYMNPTYVKEMKIDKENIGKSIFDLFPKEVAFEHYKNNGKVIAENKAITTIEQGLGADGKAIVYLVNKFPIPYQNTNIIAAWAMDVTEQQNTMQHLKEVNHFKNKLFSVISHDLRSPLTVISTLTELVAEYDQWSKEDLKEFIGNIRTANKNVISLLDELLLWARSKAKRTDYNPEKVMLSTTLPAAIDSLQQSIEEKNIKLVYAIEANAFAYADVDLLKTVVRNLVSNAVKFSPLYSTIIISAKTVNDDVEIGIADEGTGISEALKNELLKGTNVKSTYGTKDEKGIGIGLNICKDFIELNKGKMKIQNNETRGCTFSFTLPTEN